VDSIIEVVRCFENSNIIHVDGVINPINDIEIIELELIYADLETVSKRRERVKKQLKADKSLAKEDQILERLEKTLNEGKSARSKEFTKEEKEIIKGLHLLTLKPLMYVANVDEETIQNPESNENFKKVKQYAESQNAKVIPICVKLEEEISELESEEEKKEFLEMMGLDKSGLDRLVIASYDILGLMSYLTAGEVEVRAWTIRKGTKAPQAAGKIHSDIERGFIKAEIVSYDDLIKCGSMAKAREKGLIRMEGKEYTMKEGDIVDIQGTTKGKGFQGVIKRHGQARGPMAHGSRYHRRPGSMGSSATPSRVFKGKKLPGHMGNVTATVQNLTVVKVDTEKNVILVKGSVPGPKGTIVKVKG